MKFYIDRTILEYAPRTRLAIIVAEDVEIGFGHASLDRMRLRVANKVKDEVPTRDAVRLIPQLAGVDQLMERFHPRPQATTAAEQLERIANEGPMPVENDAVDAATLLMLYYKLPVFIADAAALRGDIGLVIGRATREFEVLQGHTPVDTQGRLFLTDEIGYFASPHTFGKRALVTERTHNVLLAALVPENVGDSIVRDFIRRGGNWLESLCGGQVSHEGMVGEAEIVA